MFVLCVSQVVLSCVPLQALAGPQCHVSRLLCWRIVFVFVSLCARGVREVLCNCGVVRAVERGRADCQEKNWQNCLSALSAPPL